MMTRSLGARSSASDDPWDEVWANFDARQPQAPPPAVLDRMASRARNGRVGLVLLTAASLVLLVATAYAAPLRAAGGIAEALRGGDRAAVEALVDWRALRAAPHPPAHPFLGRLEEIVQQRLGTPEGLLALAEARLGPAWPAPQMEPTGLGRARLILAGPGQPGRGLALSLACQGWLPPRWRVVGVEPLG
ncbi:DUF2939 domain-containing protein [Belnapia sp. T6]|uniref:DUF2939 domain-containing protein n=1 Tax=Belnapia mucosa TaxID=2804532 RepID=A0ABS1V2M8_9PROT|nr:DUF2939 domain-containing protein [Belnapia mucosa]MBL6454939.1 DUF2939 domain-containing protein [Belnapia mucosa]